jgi:hypothetical protein
LFCVGLTWELRANKRPDARRNTKEAQGWTM